MQRVVPVIDCNLDARGQIPERYRGCVTRVYLADLENLADQLAPADLASPAALARRVVRLMLVVETYEDPEHQHFASYRFAHQNGRPRKDADGWYWPLSVHPHQEAWVPDEAPTYKLIQVTALMSVPVPRAPRDEVEA